MSIRYIKSNLNKLHTDNLIKFIYDISIQDIEDVNLYESGRIYNMNDKVYLNIDGEHKLYQCIVDMSSNDFLYDEWEYLLDVSYDRVENISNLVIKEEVHIINEQNVSNIETNIDFIQENSSFAVYCGKKRFCINHDFKINGKNITFNSPFNVGDKVIFEVREFIGIPDGLVLRSNNGLVYEAFELGNDVYIMESTKTGRDEILIRDINDENNYRLFMEDEDVLYEITTLNTTKTAIDIKDEYDVRRKLEMIDGELYIDIYYKSGLILKSSNGNIYELRFNNGSFIAIETISEDYVTETFIKDSGNGNVIKIYMIDKEIIYNISNLNTEDSEIIIYDEYNNEYKLSIVNGEFIILI